MQDDQLPCKQRKPVSSSPSHDPIKYDLIHLRTKTTLYHTVSDILSWPSLAAIVLGQDVRESRHAFAHLQSFHHWWYAHVFTYTFPEEGYIVYPVFHEVCSVHFLVHHDVRLMSYRCLCLQCFIHCVFRIGLREAVGYYCIDLLCS